MEIYVTCKLSVMVTQMYKLISRNKTKNETLGLGKF